MYLRSLCVAHLVNIVHFVHDVLLLTSFQRNHQPKGSRCMLLRLAGHRPVPAGRSRAAAAAAAAGSLPAGEVPAGMTEGAAGAPFPELACVRVASLFRLFSLRSSPGCSLWL